MTQTETPSSAPSVLVVFPWCADHLGHGNIQRVLAIAEYLARHGVAVDFVYQGNPRVASRAHEWTRFRRVIRVEGWRSSQDAAITRDVADFYSGFEPAPANFGPGTALIGVVRGLLDAIDYTAVIATYAWTAPMFGPLTRRALRIADVQDIISRHGQRCEAATGKPTAFSMAEDTER